MAVSASIIMRIKIISMLCISLAIFLSGCGKIESGSIENGYATEFAMSAVEYSIFINKQISSAENILFTRMSMADNVMDGVYEISKEIENIDEAISKMDAILEETTITMPATNYETDRQSILNLMEDAKLALEDYKEVLESGSYSRLEAYANQLKACYVALSGEANVYYE